MNLMKGLSDDLDGIFTIENKNGTCINLTFLFDPESYPTSAESMFNQVQVV